MRMKYWGSALLVVLLGGHVHAGLGSELIKQAGKAFVRSSAKQAAEVGARQVTRKLLAETTRATAQRATGLLSKGGLADEVGGVLWRNKGVIAGGAVLATVATNPEAVIEGSTELAGDAISAVAEPLARDVAEDTHGAIWIVLLVWLLGVACVTLKSFLSNRGKAAIETAR